MTPTDVVVLRGGVVLPVEPLILMLNLEARGISVTVDEDGEHLLVKPGSALTEEERDALLRWKPHIRVIVQYSCEVVM